MPGEVRAFATDVPLVVETWALDSEDPAGAASGTPVLLLHGLSQQRRFWGPVITRLRHRPVASLDQRGHGDADSPVDADYSLDACAADVVAALDVLGWSEAVVVGHSWGGSVALHAAATAPDRVRAAALVDGGLWSPAGLGPREEVLRMLTPPALGIPADELWSRIRSGELGARWSPEVQDALSPTFVTDDAGLVRTRIGIDRHMRVVEGLLDARPDLDLDATERAGIPVWAAVCEERPGSGAGWSSVKDAAVAALAGHANLLVHRWSGAIHDVPLQWPALVAGFVDALVDEVIASRDAEEGSR